MVRESSTSPLPNQVESPRGRSKSVWHILRRSQPFDALRILLGSVLLIAAGLKAYQLATEPTLGETLLESRWFLIALVEFELLFGIWLIVGLYPKQTRLFAILCFAVLAGVSLAKVVSGEASCGCFGRITINPGYAFLLDMAALVALCYCRPNAIRLQNPKLAAVYLLVVVTMSVAVPSTILMATNPVRTPNDVGVTVVDGELIVLEPDKWVGKKFPLSNYADFGEKLTRGNWLVVLYRYDCQKCEEMFAEWRTSKYSPATGMEIALLSVPPGELTRLLPLAVTVHSSLSRDVRWFIETPSILEINEGRVLAVFADLTELRLNGALK